MRRITIKEVSCVLSFTLLLASCASVKIVPADLSGYQLHAQPIANPLPGVATLDVGAIRFSHVKTGSPFMAGYLGHNMGSINEDYAGALYKAVFGPARDSTTKNMPVLRLDGVHITQIWGDSVDIIEKGQAKWSLIDATSGYVLLQLTAYGSAGGESGWGASYAIEGRDRIGRMYQNLLENSINVFQQSEILRYISLVPYVFSNQDDLLDQAKQQWISINPDQKPELLAAQGWAAILIGDSALFHYNRNLIEASDFSNLKDESNQIHGALASENFNPGIFATIVHKSRNLDIIDGNGKRPVEVALGKENIDAALLLLKNGASARFQLYGDSYISAETYSSLAGQIQDSPEQARRVATDSIAHYRQAIKVAESTIVGNESSIWAKNIVNVIGPGIQGMVASVQARAQAQQMLNQTGSYGVGVVFYEVKQFDTDDPARAITSLQELIRHCKQRIDNLTLQLAS